MAAEAVRAVGGIRRRRISRVNAGKRFPAPEGVEVVRTFHSKPARRIVRTTARKAASRIDVKIAAAQRDRSDARSATDNSHEARRLLEKERASKRKERFTRRAAIRVGRGW